MQGVAIGYARVSTLGQANEGVSLEAQKARFEAWCLAHDRMVAGFFVDAISGKRADNRPSLQKALDEISRLAKRKRSAGAPPVLVFYSLSRLARSTKDAIQIAERLDKAAADFVSLTEDLNTTTATGKMYFRLMAILAEFERDQISERTSAALQHMRAQSKLVGAVPYGFGLDPDGESLHPIPHEQEAIAKMLAWRTEGLTLRAIAARLQAEGILPKQRITKNRPVAGTRWHSKNVGEILRRHAQKIAAACNG